VCCTHPGIDDHCLTLAGAAPCIEPLSQCTFFTHGKNPYKSLADHGLM